MSSGRRAGYGLRHRFGGRQPGHSLGSDFPLPKAPNGHTPGMTMSKLRTATASVGVLIVLGLAVFIRGYRAEERARALTPGEVSRAAGAMNAISKGNPPPLAAGVDTPPEGPNGKLAWFLRKYSERYAAAQRQMALKQGADIDALPREWLSRCGERALPGIDGQHRQDHSGRVKDGIGGLR
jgi:hypothetical protein